MDSLGLNKACAAVLVAGIAFMGATLLGDGLVSPQKLAKTAYQPIMPQAPKAAAPVAAPDPPVALLLASADVANGEATTKSQGCVACHSFNQGGKAGVGPNLYGVVGAQHGHMEGYNYSAALKSKTGPWTYDELNEWLRKPAAYAPGTKMTYAGLTDPKKRADVIDYLRTLAANPEPLPPPPAPAKPTQAGASQVTATPSPAIPGAAATTNAAPASGGAPAGAAGAPAGTAAPAGMNATQSAAAPAGGVAPAAGGAVAGPNSTSSAAAPAGGVVPTGNQGVGGMGAATSKAP